MGYFRFPKDLKQTAEVEDLERKFRRLFICLDLLDYKSDIRFLDFLKSPYFNKDQTVPILFDRLRKKRGKSMNGVSTIEYIYGKGIGIKEGAKALTETAKALEKLIYTFIAHEELYEPDLEYNRNFIKALKKTPVISAYHQFCQKAIEYYEKDALAPMPLNELWWLYHQYYFHQDGQHLEKKAQYLKEADHKLNEFFLLTKLRYYCEHINRKFNTTDNFSLGHVELVAQIADDYQGDNPAILLYIDIFRLLEAGQLNLEEYKNELKERWKERLPELATADQLVFIKLLNNQFNRQVATGKLGMIEEVHDWNKYALEKGLYTFENIISDDEYLNIAITASTCGDDSFFASFTKAHKNKMDASVKEKAYQTAKAFRHFHKAEYERAISILENVFPSHSQDSIKYMLRARSLALRCYLCLYLQSFDNEAYENFPNDYLKFKNYLDYHKNNIAKKILESYLNFIDICKDIFWAKKREYSIRPKTKKQLLEQLRNTENVAVRIWLTKTIKNL